ncbi:hypothetical protein [Advenella alkanexedens]|uniref:hypothetical protein n=1 Tax=Advenella alkanexedens TaxID=1481665 RepID=UPI0026766369|nr:hypothetical protein [Advenella alkanexedens]WKU18661.1 hypothetical protein Q3V95_10170 [Advenella alkanexedens]
MNKIILPLLVGTLSLGSSFAVQAHDVSEAVAKSPPEAPYKAVSSLVKLPDFIPGLGQLFVDPATLSAGLFLAYDRDGKLVSTIYMIPIQDMVPE